MASDEGLPVRRFGRPSLKLPGIRRLTVRRARPAQPKLRNFESRVPADQEVIEFIVELSGPVPARAYGPALYVGDVQIFNSERIDDTTWRLTSFEPERLKLGAPVSWGWMNDPPEARGQTDYRFDLADEGDLTAS